MRSTEVVIIGAGAAGLMCALTAAARGRKVMLIDHANKAGKKILMSGGGRCNFTNMYTEPANFLSQNPHFWQIRPGPLHPVGLHRRWWPSMACPTTRRSSASCSAITSPATSSTCCSTSAIQTGVSLHLDTSMQEIDKLDSGYRLQTTLGRTALRVPGDRHRRPVDSDLGRHRLWLSGGQAIRPRTAADPRRAGAVHHHRPAQGLCAASCPAPRWTAWSAATTRAFARTSCLPTAA